MDLGWFSFRSVAPTGPLLDGSWVPFTTQLNMGLPCEMPRNEGVMSSMTSETRLSMKVRFSVLQLPSEPWESAGDGKEVPIRPAGRLTVGLLRGSSMLAMWRSRKSAMLRGASRWVLESKPTHETLASTHRVHAGTFPSH